MTTETKVEVVAWQRRIRGDSGRWLAWTDYTPSEINKPFPAKIGRWDAQYRPLVLQSAITALEVEVARLRTEAAKWQGLYKSLELVCEVQERRIERGTALTKETP